MKMYTAGYTGHDGYPVTLAEGDSISEVIDNLPFDVDVSSCEDPEYPGEDAIPLIVEEIQKNDGVPGWIRQAPFTALMLGHAGPDDMNRLNVPSRIGVPDELLGGLAGLDGRGGLKGRDCLVVKYRVSGTSLEDVTTKILRRSETFAIEAYQCTRNANQTTGTTLIPLGTHDIGVHVSLTENGFDITGISAINGLTPADVKIIASTYSNPDEGVFTSFVCMSPTAEVEDAARRVKIAENARLKAVRRAADEGVSQRVLARLTGVSQATIGRWLKDD